MNMNIYFLLSPSYIYFDESQSISLHFMGFVMKLFFRSFLTSCHITTFQLQHIGHGMKNLTKLTSLDLSDNFFSERIRPVEFWSIPDQIKVGI